MYATPDDLSTRLAGFFDQLYPDPDVAAADLAAAAAEVDALAGVRYALPLVPEELVKNWTLTLAEELAWSRSSPGKLPENVIDRVAAVRKQLEMLSAGKLVLSSQIESPASGSASSVIVEGNEPQFTRDKLRGY